MEYETPKVIGPGKPICFTGCCTPSYLNDMPFVIRPPHITGYAIITFDTIDMLRTAMKELKVPDEIWKPKRIDNGIEFIASVFENDGVILMHNLRTEPSNGKNRWTQITREMFKEKPENYN